MKQTTIGRIVSLRGIGLHSGQDVTMRVLPAFPDTGIRILKTDTKGLKDVQVSAYNVTSTELATSVGEGDSAVKTIEHLMSALYGIGIDNALVEVEGPEIPIMDGSAKPITQMLIDAGIKCLAKPRKYLKINKKVRLEYNEKWIEIIPSRFFKVTLAIDFKNSFIGQQKGFVKITPESYLHEISGARTFGFKNEVERLTQMGLAKGGSLENALIVSEDGVLNEGGLRYEDEFVRHKILDLIGDISLVGYRILGHIRGYKTGHHLNNLFARELLQRTDAYTIYEAEDLNIEDKELVLKPQGTV